MSRAVAFLDVLGFRSLVQDEPLESLIDRYVSAIDQVAALNSRAPDSDSRWKYLPQHRPGEPWCHFSVFSDSIILIALDETEESCLKLLFYARLLFIGMLAEKLPVRGAVAAGELFHDINRNLTVGKALTEAYELEQAQDWVGAVVADSVWECYPRLANLCEDPESVLHYYFLEYDVPFKTGKKRARILNWRFNTVFEPGTRKVLIDSRVDKVKIKFDNTIDFVQHVVQSGALYIADESIKPAECPVFWVGSSRPPFKQGDEL